MDVSKDTLVTHAVSKPSWSKSPTEKEKKGSRDTFIFKKNSQQLSFFFCFGLSNFESEETKYKKIKEHNIKIDGSNTIKIYK